LVEKTFLNSPLLLWKKLWKKVGMSKKKQGNQGKEQVAYFLGFLLIFN